MAKVLSQDEIDALLTNVGDAPESPAEPEPLPQTTSNRKAVSYDFRHPNRVSKDQLRTLESLHDNFASQLGSSLSGFTRSVVDVDLLSVDQITYSEFIISLVAPSCTYVVSMHPLEGLGIIDFNPSVAFSFVDRMFGGRGKTITAERELTGIEKSIMFKVVGRAFAALTKSWEHVIKLEFAQSAFETNPQFIQIIPPGETVIVVSMQVKMLSSSGIVTVCYPYLSLESIMDKLSAQHWIDANKRNADKNALETNTRQLSNVRADLVAILGETKLTLKELIDIKPGDVIRLDAFENDEIGLYVGAKPKFLARPGLSGNQKAVKITDVVA